MRGFLIVCATVLVAIAIGVTVIAVQAPPGFYECPTTKYCLDLAKAVGVRGPILVPSEPALTGRTGLLVQDRLFYFGDFPSYDQPDVPGQPLWLLRYDLSGPGNLRPLYFFVTDESLWTEAGATACARHVLAYRDGSYSYVTPALASNRRRFCYELTLGGGHLQNLDVWGKFGSLGYIIRLNASPLRPFPGGATSLAALRWVEGVVASLKVEP